MPPSLLWSYIQPTRHYNRRAIPQIYLPSVDEADPEIVCFLVIFNKDTEKNYVFNLQVIKKL
jgi:hypothetical protein